MSCSRMVIHIVLVFELLSLGMFSYEFVYARTLSDSLMFLGWYMYVGQVKSVSHLLGIRGTVSTN